MNRVTQYALDVVEGRIVTGKYARLACERHLKDLERAESTLFKYEFNEEEANRIIEFSETLILAEGEEQETLKLADFQAFILGSLFGWVNKETGYRRYRTSYVQLGRQNGKSLLNGILGTFCSGFDGYKYAQIYCTATKSDQAKIVFNEIVKFIQADEDLEELFKVKEYESTIVSFLTHSTVKALGRDTKSIDGFRPYLGIVDEYHAHKDNQMYKLLEGGTGKLKQSLISVITTAGFDLNSPCFQLYEYCKKLLEGGYENETQFVYIAQLDKEDDIWEPSNWVKANPLICADDEGIERIQDIAAKAKAMGGEELRDFLTKRVNDWVQMTDNDYINIENWNLCASDLTLEDMTGKECVVGLDLSSGGDLTSLALEFPILMENERKYFIHSHSFIPKNRVQEHIKLDHAPYDIWLKEGLLTTTETLGGVKTDYKYIISYLRSLKEQYNLSFKAIAYDPHNADTFLLDLEEFGCDCIEIVQSAKSLHQATEDFSLEVDAKNVLYNRHNKLLTWSAINAKLTWNSFGECKVDKNYRTKRIDPIDAVLDAHKIVVMNREENLDINESTEDYLKMMGW